MNNHTTDRQAAVSQESGGPGATITSPASTAGGQTKHSPKIELPLLQRAALSPNEFASLFGRETTWGYRQVYAGRVKVIRRLGRMLIPQTEVQRLLADLEVYSGSDRKTPRRRNASKA